MEMEKDCEDRWFREGWQGVEVRVKCLTLNVIKSQVLIRHPSGRGLFG